MLLPLPSTASYQPARPFDPDGYSGLTMLRRINPEAAPHPGPVLHWDVLYSLALDRPARLLWQPLVALSLCANPVLRLWARNQVNPVDGSTSCSNSVQWETWTPDGRTELERPKTGEFGLDANVPMMPRFPAELAPLMSTALSTKKSGARLRRCAEHFLTAGEQAHGEGEVLSELNANAVLHYVIVLEGLLAGDDPDRGEFTCKVSQRAAVLGGTNDGQRLDFEQLVRGAYRARSAYAHGSTPREIDLPQLRRVVCRCLHTRLLLGDPTENGPLHVAADRALLSQEVLERCIRKPFSEFMRRVRTS